MNDTNQIAISTDAPEPRVSVLECGVRAPISNGPEPLAPAATLCPPSPAAFPRLTPGPGGNSQPPFASLPVPSAVNSQFSLATARVLAHWSQRAYAESDLCDPATDTHVLVRLIGDEPSPSLPQCDSSGAGRGRLVPGCSLCIIVAFRGTASLRNFIEDAECWKVRVAAGSVHSGFYRCLLGIEAELTRRILALGAGTSSSPLQARPIFVTGHSLGGAIAALFASRWTNPSYPIAQTCTFGQPRVGDKPWADHFTALHGSKTFRVINEDDLIPRLPGVLAGFRHAGQEVFFPAFSSSSSSFWLNPPWHRKLFSDARALWRAYRTHTDVLLRDHHIASYLERLI